MSRIPLERPPRQRCLGAGIVAALFAGNRVKCWACGRVFGTQPRYRYTCEARGAVALLPFHSPEKRRPPAPSSAE